jgi:phosphatidylethanolamine-binding protein (PEBP) family uncharacterized protein
MRGISSVVIWGSLVVWPVLSLTAWAHPGGHGGNSDAARSRTFRLAAGDRVARGSLVMVRGGQVRILTENGPQVEVPLDDLSELDRLWISRRVAQMQELNSAPPVAIARPAGVGEDRPAGQAEGAPMIAHHFSPFEKTVGLRWDEKFLYVESNGIPDHPLMVGIRSWQQQVPLPQNYRGGNAWSIPRNPIPAKEPQSTRNDFLRGAIALAVNGVPIFNPLNNRGEDAFLAGELDDYGGHCGRADDYHYHLAPVHLEKVVGRGNPIAYALDGYPIYGYQQPDDADFAPLDKFNGHQGTDGAYHYHATKTYPYLNGGFHGQVTKREGQVDPQPRAEPVREALPPLRGARITKFERVQEHHYRLIYEISGRPGTVEYEIGKEGRVVFTYRDVRGQVSTEVAEARRPGKGRDQGGPSDAARRSRQPQRNGGPAAKPKDAAAADLGLSSQSIDAEGLLSMACTCDGRSQSPAIAWKQLPKEAKFWAVSLWHTAPDQEKSYWLVYDIPANVSELRQGAQPPGKLGQNDRRKFDYDPLCSKGPGRKLYHLTVYALKDHPKWPPGDKSRARFLESIQGLVLAEETLDFEYSRRGKD